MDILQQALALERVKIPNETSELQEWERLTKGIEIAISTLSVLYEIVPDKPIDRPTDAEVSGFKSAFENAIQNLRNGCSHLDKQTMSTDGTHWAAAHKIGVCSVVGSVLAGPAGVSVGTAAVAIAAILYGSGFAKSAKSFFREVKDLGVVCFSLPLGSTSSVDS